jgi:formylglycine-generating enzyme required for sulfatase activity
VKTRFAPFVFGLLALPTFAQEAGKPFELAPPGVSVPIRMLPVPAGEFRMGSPATEKGRQPDEGPQVNVTVEPFWMSATEITHDQFAPFRFEDKDAPPVPDAISRPTAQYIDLTWGMGKEGGFPANSMQPYTALSYCKWLYKKTGQFYRLPTEAEWEYACRAGSQGTYPAGVTAANLKEYAWFAGNATDRYHKVGQKKPNVWGFYDLLGNVAEWTMDKYDAAYFGKLAADPNGTFFVKPDKPRAYRTARGGGFKSQPEGLRCAERLPQVEAWNQRDPQIPRSKWWMTDGESVGFRLVRPLKQPTPEEAEAFFKEMLGQ